MTTTTTRYAYDMWNPAKAGATGTSGSDIWATFTSGGSLTMRELQGDGIDQHLAYVAGSNAYWYLTDHLNSIRTVLDGSGGVTASVAYDAYGNLTTGAAPGLYDWTGRELDLETGLQYNRARYYDSTTGRWISQDPMGFDAGDSNLYRYVLNMPTDIKDPTGLAPDGIPDDVLGMLLTTGLPVSPRTNSGLDLNGLAGDMKNQSGSAIVNLEQPPKMGIQKINPIKGDLYLSVRFLQPGEIIHYYSPFRKTWVDEVTPAQSDIYQKSDGFSTTRRFEVRCDAVVALRSKTGQDVRGLHLEQDLTGVVALASSLMQQDERKPALWPDDSPGWRFPKQRCSAPATPANASRF